MYKGTTLYGRKTTFEWPNVEFEVWNVSFGGTFLLKSGLGFLFRATETPLSECVLRVFYAFLRILRGFGHPENGTSGARTEKAKTLFNRNMPPKLTFHTSKSTFGHSKVFFRPFKVVPLYIYTVNRKNLPPLERSVRVQKRKQFWNRWTKWNNL